MSSMLHVKQWSAGMRIALTATQIIAKLAHLDDWRLSGGEVEGQSVAIEKTYTFANYFETIAFVNAVAFVAHAQDHHPDLSVHYNRCVVRLNTHDVGGISQTDIDCATQIDALLPVDSASKNSVKDAV
ncbi:MAG: 4a-hydroxytetrahydrobiopterin dehydratase [Burkholderiaceae bacterium]|nr:4a-hydroxytetrahydrobiopterin dehydratase [Burkholderiaceae bacterium]